ncbi:MAG: class I SAM-dependent methyltransferase [Immundisolibacter sp.]|uniref:class I SAM-dependent methyltransferase n=1 Tax=Immundisolibacter sp. TaxID=1934948 RepID=UPI0019BD4B78|nr:class I SAM-dependent methyltransferase [Immundisolibacter sp.]MBC7162764.1 class I SAM-dependent methyltransferase [Immundisolibacter sp.]
MNIHAIHAQIFKVWRQKRMVKFEAIIQPRAEDLVLDVGGYPGTWTTRPQLAKRIDCLNLHKVEFDGGRYPKHHITTSVGDGCSLTYDKNSYDILFSNSVIEHVGDWEKQKAFAREVRRVGKRLWIQTPAIECPIEPHFLALFVHWLPVFVRRRLLRWLTPWGWIQRPSQEKIDETIAFTRLLSKKQVKELFPDCVVVTERLLWVIPKSYIAYRINSEQADAVNALPRVTDP